MCINYKTSIISFLIGSISGLLLYNNGNNIGLFVIFFSFIQLFEAFLYKYNNKIFSQLLLLNLGLQGLFFFTLMSTKYNVNKFYIILSIVISLITIYYILNFDNLIILDKTNNFCVDKKNGCLIWNFINNDIIVYSLGLMYYIIMIWLLLSKEKQLNNVGLILLFTYIYSYYNRKISNSPSFWCMTSAIASPLFLFV